MDGLDRQVSLRMLQVEFDRLKHLVNTRQQLGEKKYYSINDFIRIAIMEKMMRERSQMDAEQSYEKRWRSEGTWGK
jgi:hypothetical protein